ncbi:DUF1631 family protein [Acidovorax sp.]|uniref:DUF1631 family protein n=1 Tax=Acidovorax sp. TaxID=1872122 RepID=UPI00391D53E8
MAPHTPSAHAPARAPAPHERITTEVLAQAGPLLERVADAARTTLQQRQDQARTPGEHQALQGARQQLTHLTPVMRDRYPDALRQAMAQTAAQADAAPTRSLFSIHFDELELMDENQVNESVERARAKQVLVTAVEGPLADLDALVCGALGLPRVQPEHNPLRPDVFLQALQTVVSQMQLSPQVRTDWMGPMAQALGNELRGLYRTQIDRLKQAGVQPVGYAMRQADGNLLYVAPAAGGASPGFAADNDLAEARSSGDPLLTLDRLRRLLLGEFMAPQVPPAAPAAGDGAGAPSPEESFADRFAREFDNNPAQLPQIDAPATDFAMTVPAAFEALQEMDQVGHMMQRLGSGGTEALRQPQQSAGLGQALSMEVVALMVDNIAHDPRLLWPVQQFIRALEPALMQLAVADPRFFSHKDHAARRLLQDITDRSLAFNSTEAPGFQSFMRSLMNIAGPLSTATIDSAHHFEEALKQLHAKWDEKEQARKAERARAIETLQHAEQRHALAATLSRDLAQRPHIDRVPEEVAQFLLGPWAQVLAEARLTNPDDSPDPGLYHALVDRLIWSAQPELTRQNTAELARMLPTLLPRLREGLALIDYPATRTDAVFELLMQQHQAAFAKPAAGTATHGQDATTDAGAPAAAAPRALTEPAALADDEPWLAPAEAKESGYMDISAADGENLPAVPEADAVADQHAGDAAPPHHQPAPATPCPPLAVGNWVNLLVSGQWERTQLSWIGKHGTLFLFTSAAGRTQSMTQRLLDRLYQHGALEVLTDHPVVDVALDAVAEQAMRNSVESRL